LGLSYARTGDYTKGVRQIESAVKALYDWLASNNARAPFDTAWDPQREIRSELERILVLISRAGVEYEKLLSSAEWVGQRIEDEIDHVQRDLSWQVE
jgi:hypothetical protein